LDFLEEIKVVRTARNHTIAEYNEIVAGLYAGSHIYAEEALRVSGERMVNAKAKLLSLGTALARQLVRADKVRAHEVLSDSINRFRLTNHMVGGGWRP